jgi:tetratricopeptide (TPR) repeat protein
VLTDRLDEALDQARLWVDKAPEPIAFINLAMVRSARGEVDEALEVMRTAQERWGDESLRAGSLVDADELERLDAAIERLGEPPPEWRWGEAEYLALRGRVRDAIRTLDRNMPDASRDAERRADTDTANWWLTVKAAVLLARGDRAGVERAVGDARRFSGPEPIHAWLLADAGAPRLARAMGGSAPDRLLGHRLARAIHDWKAGDREAALAELEATASPASALYRAEIMAETGRYREAMEACRRYRRLRHGATSTLAARLEHVLVPRSLYLEAVSLEALGEDEEAHRVITRLLRLWKRADPDLPLLAQAMALDRRLRSAEPDGRR